MLMIPITIVYTVNALINILLRKGVYCRRAFKRGWAVIRKFTQEEKLVEENYSVCDADNIQAGFL